MDFQPIKFTDILMEKVWGGDALGRFLERNVPEGARIGESWELSGHRNGPSRIREGAFDGQALDEVVKAHPREILGKKTAAAGAVMPLLIKFIDANDRLSIQVHPDDAYARTHENDLGKTEAWYVVRAAHGAKIICGLRGNVTPDEIRAGLAANSIEKLLNEFTVKAGDCIFVPAGTVHAIESGVVLYEVQQASDVTYRLYDWGRTGDGGKPRALHVEESLEVMNRRDTADHRTAPVRIKGKGFTRYVLAGCGYFILEKYYITGEAERPGRDCFEAVTTLAGRGALLCGGRNIPVCAGETVLVPAAAGDYRLVAADKPLECLLVYVPESAGEIVRELLSLGVTREQMEKLGGLL
jgi:mannose-6-phosphate isomerase